MKITIRRETDKSSDKASDTSGSSAGTADTGDVSAADASSGLASGDGADAADADLPFIDTPACVEGEVYDAGITCEQAMELVKKYNEDEFHHTHAQTVSDLMRYYAKKYDPQNEEFWAVVGMLHDLDWEKWQDEHLHTVKTTELLQEAGVDMHVAHAIQTHKSDYNARLPKPSHKMEKVLWACDETSGLIGATIAMYPSKSAAELNLKSLKKKYKNKKFAAGCDRENIARGAELNGMEVEELLAELITATKEISGVPAE